MNVSCSQLFQMPARFPAELITNTIFRDHDAQIQHVQQNDGDLGPFGKTVDQLEHLEWAPGHIDWKQDPFRSHSGRRAKARLDSAHREHINQS